MSPGAYTQAHSPTPALQSCSSEPLASPRGHLWCHGAPRNDAKPRPRPWLQTPTPHDPGRRAFSSGLRSPVCSMCWHAPGRHSRAAGDARTGCGPWTELAQKQVPPLVRDGPVIQRCKKRPVTVLASRNCAEQTICHQSTFLTLLYTERNYKAIVLFKNMSIFVENLLLVVIKIKCCDVLKLHCLLFVTRRM